MKGATMLALLLGLVGSTVTYANKVPYVVGLTESQATSAITTAGLTVGTKTSQCSDTIPAGTVISQSPTSGTTVPPGAAVSLVLSSGSCTPPVYFEDAHLKAAVEAALGITDPTPTDMLNLTTLNTWGSGITSLVGLEYATNLESLAMVYESISSITPLAGLTKLYYLSLSYNHSQLSIAPLSTLTNLTALHLTGTQIANLSPLSGLTNLQYLSLDQNQIANLFPLSGLTKLEGLDLSDNQISDLAPLSGLTNLTSLGLDLNPLNNDAYCTVLSLIYANNPGISLLYSTNPNPPTGVVATDGTHAGRVVISWNSRCNGPMYESRYRVYRATRVDGTKTILGGWQSTTSYNDTTAAPGTTYWYWVTGGSGGTQPGETDFSGPDTGYCSTATVVIPNVVGMTQAAAESVITSGGLTVGTKWYGESDTVPAGYVMGQDPAAGTMVAPGSAVVLTISTGPSGPSQVQAPGVLGMTQAAAESAIVSAGLVVGTETFVCNNTAPAGRVITQTPAGGTLVSAGCPMNLVFSSGPCSPTVPNVVGMTQTTAQSAITAAGLIVGTVSHAASEAVPMGNVISQNPAAGASVASGSAVNLVISSGPAAEPGTAKKIIWVSDAHQTITGAATPDDQGWVDVLRAADYEVDYRPAVSWGVGYWQTLDTAKLAALDAADLVIISRDTNSGAYANDANEVTEWNNLKTPMILLNAYLVRSNRWLWVNSTDMGARQAYYMAKAVDPLHAVFDGVTLDDDEQVVWLDPAIAPGVSSYINTTDAGNGRVIAARPDNNCIVVAQWAAGVPFYSGCTQMPGDERMLFSAGTEQTSGTNIGYGVYNLTADGETMLLNAVAYMIGEANKPANVDTSLVGWWKLDGTSGDIAYDSAGQNDGVAYGGPVWQPTGGKLGGALKFDGVNDYVQLPIGSMINSLTDTTFATWVNWSATGGDWQRIFDFGSSDKVYMYLSPRGTNVMRFAISLLGNAYLAEDQTAASAALATGWHHVAVTLDAVNKMYSLYLDGQVVGTKTAARYTPSSLGNTTQNWLGRSQYPADPYFNGSLDDFRIYDRVLNAQELQQVMLGAAPTGGDAITLENFSFELPGTAKVKGWDGACSDPTWAWLACDIPGWRSDSVVSQLTDRRIATGETFELKVDARNNWNATVLEMILYYDDVGARRPDAIQAVVISDAMREYIMTLDAVNVPASIGKKIGVEFTNVTPDPVSWLALDNVQLALGP
jgi:beta-lactam-binding protein with PASTA domain